ncbi:MULTISPECIES: ABC transporter substrate-binding protein [Paracoccus]|jgi:putative spermidine/putrescine transport system substrate-binding protein|nr:MULTISPECIES: ABC transporter substrate-binding protein [Paracoccus]MBB4625695.1 putative spermidine/putrescine transport system substrate-binding protein [Paracoccus denitrificans]MCU7427137.1 ABC transporter substrate-binding protein [Paracoccus denitrificans]QAR26643.1 ABC transporter substrate-binding protein [Paracoccus denitrificans]QFQ89097.1 extracellular solute-binding protein [Paracoccus kondratievae]UPV95591.1 ABC transporter substrate-binding protein [Paracoccus denitrificans]
MEKHEFYAAMVLASITATICGPYQSLADQITIASWGGNVTDANRAAYWEPFTTESGIAVVDDVFNGEIAKLRVQVETGSIQWDIAEVEDAEAIVGCDEGLYEFLVIDTLPIDDMLPGTVTDCGIASLSAASVLTYNGTKFEEGPKTWTDFFNLNAFPGKRGLRKSPTYTLEFALLADGVPREEIYEVLATPEGQDRAFAMLDRIKDEIVWYSSGTQQIQGFISGEYDIGVGFNARVADANREQRVDLRMSWNAGYIVGHNFWVVLAGSSRIEEVRKFLEFVTRPDRQAAFMEYIDYGSSNRESYKLLPEDRKTYLPGAGDHAEYQISYDAQFWSNHLDQLTERFNRWIGE